MTAVFKFTNREFADAAVNCGRIRLSHPATFRDTDGVEAGRSDSTELTASARILGPGERVSTTDPRFSGLFTTVRGGEVTNDTIVVVGESLTVYESGLLYCTSLDNTDELFGKMVEKFGYDAAFEIADIDEFAQRILVVLASNEPHLDGVKADLQRVVDNPNPNPDFQAAMLHQRERELERMRPLAIQLGSVEYCDALKAESVAEMSAVDVFHKPLGYAWQREHRIVITPYDCGDGVDLEDPTLCDLLRIVR